LVKVRSYKVPYAFFCTLFGSAQEFVKSGILRGLRDFVKCDVFGVGDGHALRFQE
jgi:hypothetical protein